MPKRKEKYKPKKRKNRGYGLSPANKRELERFLFNGLESQMIAHGIWHFPMERVFFMKGKIVTVHR